MPGRRECYAGDGPELDYKLKMASSLGYACVAVNEEFRTSTDAASVQRSVISLLPV